MPPQSIYELIFVLTHGAQRASNAMELAVCRRNTATYCPSDEKPRHAYPASVFISLIVVERKTLARINRAPLGADWKSLVARSATVISSVSIIVRRCCVCKVVSVPRGTFDDLQTRCTRENVHRRERRRKRKGARIESVSKRTKVQGWHRGYGGGKGREKGGSDIRDY